MAFKGSSGSDGNGLHHRRAEKAPDISPQGEEDSSESADVLKGLLQCVATIGGLSILMWIVFFYVMPPQGLSFFQGAVKETPSPVPTPPSSHHEGTPCTEVQSVKDIISALRDIADWRILGEDLGVNRAKLEMIAQDNMEAEHKKRAAIRAWYDATTKHCWEDILLVLRNMGRVKMAKDIADKYEATFSH